MPSQQDRPLDELRNTVHGYARIIRRRWRVALTAACLVGAAAFWGSQYLPRQYVATTVFERRDDVVLRNLIHSKSPYSFALLKSSIVRDMSGSRALAEAAIAAGLLPDGSITSEQALSNDEQQRVDAALSKYDLRASVHMIHSSASLDTIELRCHANDPALARRFVVALRDGYIMRTRGRISEILSGTREFFTGEVARFQQQVADAGRRLKNQFGEFPGVDPTDPVSVGARLEYVQSERLRLAQRKAEIAAQISARERFLTSSALTVASDAETGAGSVSRAAPEIGSAVEKAIAQTEQELADAIVVRRMTDEHPVVLGLRRKLQALRSARGSGAEVQVAAAAPKFGAREDLRKRDPVLAGQRLRVELELDAFRAQHEIAAASLAQAEERFNKVSSVYSRLVEASDELQGLQVRLDEDKAAAAVWRQHLTQLERVLAAENEQRGTQFALVEEPKENAYAIKPWATSILVVCLGCGLAAAVLLVALVELLDRSFRSTGQVTRTLGLPVLESIGVINTPRVKRRQLLSRLAWTPALCVLLGSLLATAALAYASLERPTLHARAMGKVDQVLETFGAPPTSLARQVGK